DFWSSSGFALQGILRRRREGNRQLTRVVMSLVSRSRIQIPNRDLLIWGKAFTIGLAMALANTATVFVVDDDASIRASIQGLLKSAGLRSEGFETAEKFLQRKPLDGPSCLILDVSLPGVSGIVFQQQLKKAGIHIPIIFLTGHGDIPM